ncbi:MAG TPA: EVE domain-containing protein [Tepidisphaeraceae bacterium]|nr:EVE domain-containing protein [Tepidisphaeraceae bacterium]
MGHWLLKTEPTSYSWSNFERDRKTVWDGVTNALALKNLRTIKKGDQAFFYHTGDERSVIGIAQAVSDPYPNPREDDDRLAVVDLKIQKKLKQPVTLSDIKADKTFEGWDFLRLGRLSVVPVPERMWKRIIELSEATP